jgi:hypothetical protein
VYGRFWAGARCDGVVFREGAGDELFPSDGLGAIADVERRFKGRDAIGLLTLRFGEDAEGFGMRCVRGGRGRSALGGGFPLLYIGGSLDDFGDGVVESFWDSDCDRCRCVASIVFFLRS